MTPTVELSPSGTVELDPGMLATCEEARATLARVGHEMFQRAILRAMLEVERVHPNAARLSYDLAAFPRYLIGQQIRKPLHTDYLGSMNQAFVSLVSGGLLKRDDDGANGDAYYALTTKGRLVASRR